MGQRGSEVAKEAANVVLVDDNFASIVRGIEEGRVLFDNLKKTIAYTLTHLLPEILPVILTIIAGLPAGLTTLQILSIDLGTELAPAISLAYEPAEKDIMLRPPRDINSDRLVSRNLLVYSYLIVGVLESIACFIACESTLGVGGKSDRRRAGTSKKKSQEEGGKSHRAKIAESVE